ncbi:small secreted protein [Streptomyces sp. NPDC059853]|uniref:small secreted protein n=1 Tax=Streptomyces sp. NPDC059853 TaxID=3346973 RepID=UPI0036461B4C
MYYGRAVRWSGGAALALALTLTGCGSDDSAKTDEWAKAVCDRMQPEVEKIRSASASITEASEGGKPAAEVQQADSAAFQEISDAYASLATIVNDAGDPPVDNGAQLRQDAVGELNSISESYAGLKTSVDELNPDDVSAFSDGLKDIAGQLSTLGQSGDEALSELQSGELGQAMAKQEGCQSAPAGGPGGGDPEEDGSDDADAGADAGKDEDADENADADADADDEDA